jgi:hypothetical protein
MAARSMVFPCVFNGNPSRPLTVDSAGWPVRKGGLEPNQEFLMTEKPKQHAEDERKRIEKEEDEVTISSDESFPASDPPSFNPGVTGPGDIKKKKRDHAH